MGLLLPDESTGMGGKQDTLHPAESHWGTIVTNSPMSHNVPVINVSINLLIAMRTDVEC